MAYACTVLADSIAKPSDVRLTTLEVTFPRIVLAEFNTHRMLSRNSASSRAIPVKTQLGRVLDDPFVPVFWGKNKSGMQAKEELSGDELAQAKEEWLSARDQAVDHARWLTDLGLHKQIANRILEPFLWHTVIVTATEWDNFFALRCHEDAQPEIRVIAEMMRSALTKSKPRARLAGEWHLPLCKDEAGLAKEGFDPVKVSAGRCARVSYLTHDGLRDPQADVDLCDKLITSGHMSPLEHQAQIQENSQAEFLGNFRAPWKQYRKMIPNEAVFHVQ